MIKDGKWYREVSWMGVSELIECGTLENDHSYAWSGTTPCTGERRCIYCGHVYKSFAPHRKRIIDAARPRRS